MEYASIFGFALAYLCFFGTRCYEMYIEKEKDIYFQVVGVLVFVASAILVAHYGKLKEIAITMMLLNVLVIVAPLVINRVKGVQLLNKESGRMIVMGILLFLPAIGIFQERHYEAMVNEHKAEVERMSSEFDKPVPKAEGDDSVYHE